jgi:hypothetical protein
MLDDNLNKRKLAEMIGAARFNTPQEFKDFLNEKLQENFLIDEKRMKVKELPEAKRVDIHIMDDMTKREVLLAIGLRTAKDTPQMNTKDIAGFHASCQAVNALFSVLMTETDVYFFEYKKQGPVEISDIKPLNYIEAEFERNMTPQKYKDLLIAKRKWVFAAGIVVALLIAYSLAQAQICKTSGEIKGEVKSSGEMVYYLPETSGYEQRTTGDQPGERRFCKEKDAIKAGFTLAN